MIKSITSQCPVALAVEKAWKAQYALLADKCAALVLNKGNSLDRLASSIAMLKMDQLHVNIQIEVHLLAKDPPEAGVICGWTDWLVRQGEMYLERSDHKLIQSMAVNLGQEEAEAIVMGNKLIVKAVEAMLEAVAMLPVPGGYSVPREASGDRLAEMEG